MTDGFLHLTDAEDGTPVRIRISKIDALSVNIEREEAQAFYGQQMVVREQEPHTMIVFGDGFMHGVKETIDEIEGQMADFYELAGMAGTSAQ